MSVIIRLQNLPLSAISIDIRNFFRGLSIPDGGVHIVGGPQGDAFIAFSTDEDARMAMQLSGQNLKDSPVALSLSSRNEMFKVIEQARQVAESGTTNSSAMKASTPSFSSLPPPPTAPSNNLTGGLPPALAGLQGMQGLLGMGLNSSSMNPNFGGGSSATPTTATAPTGISPFGPGFGKEGTVSDNSSTNANVPTLPGAAGGMTPFNIPPALAMAFPQFMPMMGMMNPQQLLSLAASAGQQQQQQLANNNAANGFGQMQPQPQNGALMPNQANTNNVRFPGMNPAFMIGGNMNMANNAPQPQQQLQQQQGQQQQPFQGRNFGGTVRPVGTVRPDFGDRSYNRSPNDRLNTPNANRDGFNNRKDADNNRRRRSRSRDRGGDRRRRGSRSRSRSRSPSKGRGYHNRNKEYDSDSSRRNSRESSLVGGRRDSKDYEIPPTPYNTTEEHHPALKITGIPGDTSFRELKDFVRADIMGGSDGVVRLYDEGIAFIKLTAPTDFPRAFRSNGRRFRGANVAAVIEGVSIERWVEEYKLNKSRMERDVDRERVRDRPHPQHRPYHREEIKSDHNKSSRPSRFSSALQWPNIVIRNLPPTATTREVSSRLQDFSVLDVAVVSGPLSAAGRHTSAAYVKLDSPDSAQKAIDHIVRSLEGSSPLVVEGTTEEEFNDAKNRTSTPSNANNKPASIAEFTLTPQQQFLNNLGAMESQSASSNGTKSLSIFDLQSGLDDESCSVMLKGVPGNVSERDVFDFFSDIGLIPTNVNVMYDSAGSCDGNVMCEFQDPHKARRATTKDGMMFGRGQVQVQLVPSGRPRNPLAIQMPMTQGGNARFPPPRPSLLGARPPGINPSRFGGPPGPNPFLQALQGPGGPRGPRPPRGRGFGGPRHDFRPQGNGEGRGRGTGTPQGGGDATSPVTFGQPGCVLGLENVPYKASMDDILSHLSSILNLDIARNRIIRRFDEADKPTGDARVSFDTPAEAKLAHDRLTGTKMWNRLISYTIL